MLNKNLEITLNHIFQVTKEKKHEFMTVEHLLLALLDNIEAKEALLACNVDIEELSLNIIQFIDANTPILNNDIDRETQPTLGFQRVLQRAVFHVQSSGKEEVSGANVLIAIFSEQESQAVYLLHQANVSRLDIVNYISHGINKDDLENFSNHHYLPFDSQSNETINEESEDPENKLENFTTNLNQIAKEDKIDPLIGRDNEIERAIQILIRRKKNNPIFVGEPGVGKTAIAEGLAYKIEKKEVPEVIQDFVIYSLDIGTLLAGTKYRGDFEKRFKSVLKQLKQRKNAILFIDEIHTIIGTGAATGGMLDASNLLKPLLSSGEIRCVGSTTYQEYQNIFDKDKALSRRFQKIDIVEPSIQDTIKILNGLKEKYEHYHNVKYTQSAIESAVKLSAKHINDRFLPDKAVDVIDEAGAKIAMLPKNKRKKNIIVSDIETIISKITRIPEKTVSTNDKKLLFNLEKNLKMLVFGQDKAISALSDSILLARSGLNQDEKPTGCFLFAGPTGVGKTEVTQQLAKILGVELIRFDMSEYMEKHSISRLVGAPPGYVGYEQGGLLTDAIIKNPYSVLLLDEIEKADHDIYNILLQIMDHGTLTDNNGRHANFKNVIIVMTTNSGVRETTKTSIGFKEQDNSLNAMDEIHREFTPEFRNRLDQIIWFNHLDETVILQVVDKFLIDLQVKLDAQSVHLEVSVKARKWLAEKGYDKDMGARPMSRLIQKEIKRKLAHDILFGELQKGGNVTIDIDSRKDNLTFSFDNTKQVSNSDKYSTV